jgi:hypothetical protein
VFDEVNKGSMGETKVPLSKYSACDLFSIFFEGT